MGFNRNSHWWLKYFAYVLSAALNPIDFYINLYKQRLNHFGVLQGEGRVKDCPFLKAVCFSATSMVFAQVKTAKGTDVANFKCTGGRQILLSNGVLARAF